MDSRVDHQNQPYNYRSRFMTLTSGPPNSWPVQHQARARAGEDATRCSERRCRLRGVASRTPGTRTHRRPGIFVGGPPRQVTTLLSRIGRSNTVTRKPYSSALYSQYSYIIRNAHYWNLEAFEIRSRMFLKSTSAVAEQPFRRTSRAMAFDTRCK